LELKKRLEDLRKAKSQTIVKKDKEYVTSDVPKLGRQSISITASSSRDSQQFSQETKKYLKEIGDLKNQITELKKSHAEEMETIKDERQKVCLYCVMD